jgi:hypothetical protein
VPIPTPEPGLVISYAYLWHHEHQAGRDEGRKDRPSVIVLAVERPVNDTTVVVVLPITHNPPTNPAGAVEIPAAVKRHLGLDDERSWIVVAEGANARLDVIASEAKQSISPPKSRMDCFVASLLATTILHLNRRRLFEN